MQRLLILISLASVFASVVAPVFAAGAMAQQGNDRPLVTGWYKDRETKYFDFGTNTKLASGGLLETAPIYVFIRGMNADGKPDLVQGQHNVVDVVPGEAGYSDLWQVMFVTVPQSYVADAAKSKADIDAAGFTITPTNTFVNCPIVPSGTMLEGGTPLTQGWDDGEAVFYPDFGENSQAAIPIWVFVEGFNADGSPQMVAGQSNIIDSKPGDVGYSAFWLVNFVTVPADYVPNSIRSAADVRASGYPVKATDMVVNCPVTTTSDVVQRSPDAPAGAAQSASAAPVTAPNAGVGAAAPDSGIDASLYAIIVAGAVAGVAATAGAVAVRRR